MSDSKKISSFRGKYEFLSNFYGCMVELEGVSFPSAERAFHAANDHQYKKIAWQISGSV